MCRAPICKNQGLDSSPRSHYLKRPLTETVGRFLWKTRWLGNLVVLSIFLVMKDSTSCASPSLQASKAPLRMESRMETRRSSLPSIGLRQTNTRSLLGKEEEQSAGGHHIAEGYGGIWPKLGLVVVGSRILYPSQIIPDKGPGPQTRSTCPKPQLP